jgi:hypothetical protein
MRSPWIGALLLLALASPARADDTAGNAKTAETVVLGETKAAPAATDDTCVEVEIGGEKAQRLDCINRQLKQQVDQVQPVGNVPPIDASSPAVRSHGFNETALQQQYGKNLGKSVIPFRPSKQSP